MTHKRIALIELNKFLTRLEREIGTPLTWFSIALVPHTNFILLTTMANIKLTIIEAKEYAFNDDKTGEEIKGMRYTAFNANNEPIVFTSDVYDHKVHANEIGYNAEKAEFIRLNVKVWNGKVKYREDVVASIEDEAEDDE